MVAGADLLRAAKQHPNGRLGVIAQAVSDETCRRISLERSTVSNIFRDAAVLATQGSGFGQRQS